MCAVAATDEVVQTLADVEGVGASTDNMDRD